MPGSCLVRQHVQVAIAEETKLHQQSVALTSQDERVTPPSHLIGMFQDPLHSSYEKDEKNPKKKNLLPLLKSRSRANQRSGNADPTKTIMMTTK